MAMARGTRSAGRILGWLVLMAVVAAVVRALRGRPTELFDEHASWNDGASWPLLEDPPRAHSDLTADEIDLRPAPAVDRSSAVVPVPDRHMAWVEPFEGECPPGYPVKAKLTSGIFHQPGGAMYVRTKPDRCYATAEEAIADGLRPAKR